MVGACEMQYWSGDRTAAAAAPEEASAVQSESASRGEKARKFTHSEFFAESIAVRPISSFPRWYMARFWFPDKMPGVGGLISVGAN